MTLEMVSSEWWKRNTPRHPLGSAAYLLWIRSKPGQRPNTAFMPGIGLQR